MEYQPYTYLIGWTKHDKWYYGAEYGKLHKIANPINLWTTYFTSSPEVEKFREEFGEPDVIKIRRVFKTSEETVAWESKLLYRIKAAENSKWLNRRNGNIGWYNKGGYNLQEKEKERRRGSGNGFFGKKHTEEQKEKWRNDRKGKKKPPVSEETKRKLSEAWKTRAPVSEETKRKISESRRGQKLNLTDEQRKRRSENTARSNRLRAQKAKSKSVSKTSSLGIL
jgi:hypothetical protein